MDWLDYWWAVATKSFFETADFVGWTRGSIVLGFLIFLFTLLWKRKHEGMPGMKDVAKSALEGGVVAIAGFALLFLLRWIDMPRQMQAEAVASASALAADMEAEADAAKSTALTEAKDAMVAAAITARDKRYQGRIAALEVRPVKGQQESTRASVRFDFQHGKAEKAGDVYRLAWYFTPKGDRATSGYSYKVVLVPQTFQGKPVLIEGSTANEAAPNAGFRIWGFQFKETDDVVPVFMAVTVKVNEPANAPFQRWFFKWGGIKDGKAEMQYFEDASAAEAKRLLSLLPRALLTLP